MYFMHKLSGQSVANNYTKKCNHIWPSISIIINFEWKWDTCHGRSNYKSNMIGEALRKNRALWYNQWFYFMLDKSYFYVPSFFFRHPFLSGSTPRDRQPLSLVDFSLNLEHENFYIIITFFLFIFLCIKI